MAEVATNGSEVLAAPAAVPAAAVFTGLKVQVTVPAGRAEEAVAFYKAAFAAEEVSRSTHPKRKGDGEEAALLCAELKVGAATLVVCDQAGDDVPAVGKEGAAASGLVLRLETDDVNTAVAQAATAGAALQGEVTEDCCGLGATLVDPFGITWVLGSSTSAKKCA
ncbi:hypothetical protein HU200_058352 [Digitaria exilis]|uniref:VOC domain-containing protein n=1 Tax=Digitaria exilis TaxID=1010633 RepID=A0A835A9V8_9POAL|nr:hypothetical protein HU200_058352 [Digitaria exilis]CAB3461954.1 unnamed protein product [Digitaria exilis]